MISRFLRRPSFDVAVDLGTSNVIVTTAEGIKINEPCFVALKTNPNTGAAQIIDIGAPAFAMLGKEPQGMRVVQPLSQGVISEFELTSSFLRVLLQRALKRNSRYFKPKLLLALPADVTPVEARAFREAGLRAGAREVMLIPEPIAAALGSTLDIFSSSAEMIVDVGGGITEISLFCLGGIVYRQSLRIGGLDMDRAIIQFIRGQHNFEIGLKSAEQLKYKMTSTQFRELGALTEALDVKGVSLVTGLPATLNLRSEEVRDAMAPLLRQIVNAVLSALEQAPAEISADLMGAGIWLVGGASYTGSLREQLQKATGLDVRYSAAPLLSVAHGELNIVRNERLAASLTCLH